MNLRSEELCKNGDKIKVPGQSFRILAMLLERPGEVVMRQEIQKRLWPDDTVVEFENSISAAIKRLRTALGDSAEQPRYIETLARRGYRWMIPVQWVEPPSVPEGVLSSRYTAKAGRTVSRKRRGLLIVSAAVVVAAASASSAYFFTHPAPKVTSKDPIIIADFTNTTGDPVFDGTLRQGLAAQLEQSPYLDILSDEQMAGTLRLMSQPTGARLTHELARQLCRRTGGVVVLDGSISQVGNQYSLVLSAVNCSTRARLGSTQVIARDKNHVLGALGSVAASIRGKLGESLASIQRFNTPLEQVTTPSLEALQAYTLGWQGSWNGDHTGTSDSFQRAILLDPNFAMAYAVLGTGYFDLGEYSQAAAYMQKAYDLRERVSEREKFYISSHYDMFVTGNLEKANQVFVLWSNTYPQDMVPVLDLGVNYFFLGQYPKALEAARRALDLAPDSGEAYANAALAYMYLGRLDEAAAILRKSKEHGINSPDTCSVAYELAFLEGDAVGMAREVDWAADKPGVADLLLDFESDTRAYAGHLAQANDLTARAVASARHIEEKETAELYQAEAALREALVGNVAEARRRATATLHASNTRDAKAMAALALAFAGGLPQAQKLANDLEKRFPQDTLAQFNYLPTIHAAIALAQKSSGKAITALELASHYELGTPAQPLPNSLNLYPVYVRGRAYLAARQGRAAAAEFQNILDHTGIAFNEVINPLAHLQIGRAYAMQGETAQAKAAYQEFLTLWKDADPDLPILIAAKSEYAKLR